MTDSFSPSELQASIEQSLQDIALQMAQPIDEKTATQLYQEASRLLSHIDYAPITLARVAGTLLVYQLQKVEPEELAWFKSQVSQSPNDEEIEELIESIHRIDSL